MFGSNEEMKSNCGDIFDEDTNSIYQEQQLVFMVRNPLERIESEFGFLSNREMFRELWQNNVHSEYPKTLQEYIEHPSNANSICRFLLGLPMYTDASVQEDQFDSIFRTLDTLPFVFGRTDQMAKTVANVSHLCGVEFGDTLPRYRTSLYKPKRDNDWETVSTIFEELNSYDIRLVSEVHKRFKIQIESLPDSDYITFEGDEYDSIYPFICADSLRSPLEIYANDLEDPQTLFDWIEKNAETLVPTLKSCLEKNSGDGKLFLVDWLQHTIPHLEIDTELNIDSNHPLQTLRILTNAITLD